MRAHEQIRELLKEGSDCLTPDQLMSLESGDLAAAERAGLEQHLAGCSRCAAERALIQSYESAAESAEERAPLAAITAELDRRRAARWPVARARKTPFWAGWFSGRPLNTWAMVAASLLVIVAGSFYLRDLRTPGLPGVTGEEVQRSVRLVAIRPAGELSQPPEQFEWKAASGRVQRYRVTVRDVGGARLWSGESEVSHLAFPPALRSRLLPGKTLTWEVEALADGKTLASSDPVRFVVRPRP